MVHCQKQIKIVGIYSNLSVLKFLMNLFPETKNFLKGHVCKLGSVDVPTYSRCLRTYERGLLIYRCYMCWVPSFVGVFFEPYSCHKGKVRKLMKFRMLVGLLMGYMIGN